MADEKYSEYVPYGAAQPAPEPDPSHAHIQSVASMHAQAINRSRQNPPENPQSSAPQSSQAPAGYVAYVAPSAANPSQSPRREAPVQQQQTFRGYVAVASFLGLDALKDSVEIYRENRQSSTVGSAGAPKAPSAISGGDTMVAVPQTNQPQRAPEVDDQAEMENLKHEHSLAGVPICVSNNELTILVGRGTAWYFRFIKFLWFINFVLFLFSLINIIPQLDDVRKLPSDEKPGFPYVFYLDSYQSDLKRPWMGSCVLSVIFLFFAGPMYSLFISWTQRRQSRGDDGIVEDPFEGQYSVDSDDCIDKIPYEVQPLRSQQLLRRFFSLCVFGLVLLLQAIVTYYLQQALAATSSSRAATAIAAVMSFINLCWKTICAYLTRLELHLYYSSFRRWEVMKVFIFKLLNVLVLFFVKRYEVLTNTDNCPLFLMADQFLLLLLFDIALGIFVDLFLPFFYNCFIVRRLRVKENEADDANKVEWNLADEYVGVMYRQFLVSLGLLVNPMLPCVALLGNFLEYYLDRYRLLRVVERPKRTKSTFKNVLMFFFFLVWLCVLLTFPNGVIWILSGVAIQDRCAIFQ